VLPCFADTYVKVEWHTLLAFLAQGLPVTHSSLELESNRHPYGRIACCATRFPACALHCAGV
jgi:hypothetical protein